MILALLLAVVAPLPTPSPSVQCEGRCLAGITIGDNANQVLSRLGSFPIPGSDQRVMGDFESYANGLMLAVYYYRGGIVGISITSTQPDARIQITDPYGIRLGTAATQLTAMRGAPTSTSGNVWRYGTVNAIHWDYTVSGGSITTILVSSVQTP